MRSIPLLCVLLLLGLPLRAETPASADSFVDSVGVNIHLNYTDSIYYTNFPLVLQALRDLNVRHVRDGIHDLPFYYTNHNALAAAGIHTNYAVGLNVPEALTRSWSARVQDLESLEATNEADDGSDPNWVADVQSQLAWLGPYAKSIHVPMVGPSLVNSQWWLPAQNSYTKLGDISQYIAFNNLHNYLAGFSPETSGWGGCNSKNHCYGSIAWNLDEANIDAPNVPVWTTENGYNMNATANNSIPEWVYGVYGPRLLLEQWNAGIKRTFIYELADDPGTPGFMGLIDKNGNRRLPFVAISNLLALLKDSGTALTLGAFEYTLTASSDIQHTLVAKRDGSVWLILWNGKPVYDPNSKSTLSVPPQQVKVSWKSGAGFQIHTFDPNGRVTDGANSSGNSTVLTVGSALTVLEIRQNAPVGLKVVSFN